MNFDIITEKDILITDLEMYKPFSGVLTLNVSTLPHTQILNSNFIYGIRLRTEVLIIYAHSKYIEHLNITDNLVIQSFKYIKIKRIFLEG